MSQTTQNAQAAFAGESQANRRYLYFAEKADHEGYRQIARLFRAIAEAETVHARSHLMVLGEIRSTRENLQAAIAGEHYEYTRMYPGFIKQAEADKEEQARTSFNFANEVEKVHHRLFLSALGDMDKGQPAPLTAFFVCQGCGHTVEGVALEVCPICGAPKSMFKQVD